MTKKNLFSVMAMAFCGLAILSSCDKSPKADEQPAATTASEPSDLRIAYVEVDSLMTQYEYCKEYSLILEKKSQNIQATLQQKGQALQQAANNFQQKLQQNALQQRLSAEFQEETAKFNEALHDSLQHFLTKYNKDKKYTMILSKSGDNILYADKTIDITNDIITGLNKAYKKGSATEKKK